MLTSSPLCSSVFANSQWYFSLNSPNAKCIFVLKCLCISVLHALYLLFDLTVYHSFTILDKNELFYNTVYLTKHGVNIIYGRLIGKGFLLTLSLALTLDISIGNEAAINSYTESTLEPFTRF